MPENKVNERLLRIKVIDELFSSKPGKTFGSQEIIEYVSSRNSRWEYNRFKLRRDIEYLVQNQAVKLKEEFSKPENGRGRPIQKWGYPDGNTSLFKDNLNEDDRKLIIDILEILQLKGIVQSFVRFESKYKKRNSNKSPIISFTKNPRERDISTHLHNLLIHIRQNDFIKLRIKSRTDDTEISEHYVSPWYLREYNRRWYLFGKEGDEVKHYAVDRIARITFSKKSTYVPPERNIDDILEDVVGVSLDPASKVEEIVFWVSYESADFVDKKPIHKSQQKIDKEEAERLVGKDLLEKLPPKNGIFLKMYCIDNYELKREMMSFGEELIVLSPNNLREFIKKKLKEMLNNYQG